MRTLFAITWILFSIWTSLPVFSYGTYGPVIVPARTLSLISSEQSQPGDFVEVQTWLPIYATFSNGQRFTIPQHSTFTGQIIKAQKARRLNRKGKINVVFYQVRTPFGNILRTNASLTAERRKFLILKKREFGEISGDRSLKDKILGKGVSTALSTATRLTLGTPVGLGVNAATFAIKKGGRVDIQPGDNIEIYVYDIGF